MPIEICTVHTTRHTTHILCASNTLIYLLSNIHMVHKTGETQYIAKIHLKLALSINCVIIYKYIYETKIWMLFQPILPFLSSSPLFFYLLFNSNVWHILRVSLDYNKIFEFGNKTKINLSIFVCRFNLTPPAVPPLPKL